MTRKQFQQVIRRGMGSCLLEIELCAKIEDYRGYELRQPPRLADGHARQDDELHLRQQRRRLDKAHLRQRKYRRLRL